MGPRASHTAYSGRQEPIEINAPVVCGGVLVRPGDLVIADEIGAVVVPSDRLTEVYKLAREQADREEETRRAIMPVPPWRICWPVSAGYKEKEMCRLRKCLLLLDGGTTNTRFTLVENNQILAQSQCRTGAVDAAREGKIIFYRQRCARNECLAEPMGLLHRGNIRRR